MLTAHSLMSTPRTPILEGQLVKNKEKIKFLLVTTILQCKKSKKKINSSLQLQMDLQNNKRLKNCT